MHKRPAGKIRLYTRAAKVSQFEILCRVYGITPTVGLFRCFYVNSKKNGWMSFIKRSDKSPIWIFSLSFTPQIPLSVDKLFDEGGSGTQTKQGDFAGGGGEQGINIQPFTKTTDTIAEDVIPLQPRRQKKRKTAAAEVGGSSHPPKKLREDHETPNGPPIDGKSRSSVLVMTAVTTTTPTADPDVIVKEKTVKPSMFASNSSSAGGADPDAGEEQIHPPFHSKHDRHLSETHWLRSIGARTPFKDQYQVDDSTNTTNNEVTPGKIRKNTSIRISSTSGRRIGIKHGGFNSFLFHNHIRISRGVVVVTAVITRTEDLTRESASASTTLTPECKHDRHLSETHWLRSIGARTPFKDQYQDEVNALNERNTILEKERNALDVKVTDLEAAVVHELQVSSSGLKEKLANYENLTERLEEFQDAQLKVVNDKFDKLCTDFVEMTLHLKERFYRHFLTTIVGRRWLLTYGMELAIVKCLNSPEYLSTLEEAISKAIEKGIVEALISILRLEEHLAERLGLNESQPHAEQLMVPIYHSPEQTVVGAYALSLALDVSDARVRRIRENIERHQSFLHSVFIPFAEPFFAAALTFTEGTSATAPGTTTALSTTFVSASSIPPISTDDYDAVRLDGQEGAGVESQAIADGNADPFANIDDVDLNVFHVFIPFAEPFFAAALTCTEGTSATAPGTTTALSTTFVSASSITPISTDDYDAVRLDGQEGAGVESQAIANGNADPFANIDDVDLNVFQ
nr:hypothetical protein [Tanacetum cinerariifolium]